MIAKVKRAWTELAACVDRFRSDSRGQIVIIFALASTAIVIGVGSGVDLSRAYAARQRLSAVATLTCQYANRPSIVSVANTTYSGANGFNAYKTAVNAFATSNLASQHWVGPAPTPAGAYFTATQATGSGGTTSTAPTALKVEMSANVPTSFMQIARITQIPVHALIACATPGYSSTPGSPSPAGSSWTPKSAPTLVAEGFETSCSSYCFTQPNGSSSTIANPTTAFTAAASYIGSGGARWYIVGYCLEADIVGVINSSTPEGTHSAELDCDNGHGNAGNSSISTNVYLAAGNYELRYNYRSRVTYADYDPAYICGSTASDTAWANDTNSFFGSVLRTNQINAYLDMGTLGGVTPLHTTIDGSQQLAGTNLIDTCVYSASWLERSVRITVTTPAYYWLSFAADGASDSYGGQLDNIRLCQETCAGSLQDNFPTAWLPGSNGVGNKALFEDTFESPTYTQDYPYHYIAKGGNLNLSTGTSGTAASGWPALASAGWATAPFNQITYALNGAYQGSQYIALDGFNANGNAAKNRLISRPFLLDPGYYQVSYDYISMVNFSLPYVPPTCFSAPASGQIFPATGTGNGQIRYYNSTTTNYDTNIVAVFMSHSQLVSTPVTGNSQGSATSYTNPDASVSTTPTVPPDSVNWQSYNAAVVNPVIDVCGYVDAWNWIARTVSVKISKPGLYWLSFSSQQSTADGNGGGIDDIKLTALGSPYMASPPTSALTAIPVPAPQPDTSYSNTGAFNGFSIVADPFMPPAANQ